MNQPSPQPSPRGRGSSQPLFEPGFLSVLESLTLAGRRVPAGRSMGQWRSRSTGSSIEFSDYRTYAPGDDYRRIDWNAYARLERLFLRLYRAEENLALSLIVDTSASMAWGTPSKSLLAARLAAALSFIGLRSDDRVELAACRSGGVADRILSLTGQAAVWPLWSYLQRLSCAGSTDLDASLTGYATQLRSSGLAIVMSDLLSPAGYQRGIDALLARRQDVVLVQVLAPDEIEPPADLMGEWWLLDSEDTESIDATITPSVVRAYRDVLATYTREIADFCRRRGVTYLLLRSDVRLEDVLLRSFRQAGVLV
jgi:uncharacterized protein (DUF58 family)